MSQDDLRRLQEEERKLRERLAALRAEREAVERAERREAERTKPIVIRAESRWGTAVFVRSDFREDLLAIYRETPGRSFRGGDQNTIPIAQWSEFTKRVEALEGVSLKYAKGLEDEIAWAVAAPPWEVTMTPIDFRLKPGPVTARHGIHPMPPGSKWDDSGAVWTIPLTEAWRLGELLSEVEGVVWDDGAREYVIKQVEGRAALDVIARAEVAPEISERLTLPDGHSLMGFQEVGVKFSELSGGRILLSDDPGLGKTWQAIAYEILVNKGLEENADRSARRSARTLVISPAGLKPKWEREIRELTGEEPVVLEGTKPGLGAVQMTMKQPRYVIINYDIIGHTTEFEDFVEDEEGNERKQVTRRRLWLEFINSYGFDIIILDESHYIKNPEANRTRACLKLEAPHIIGMTATPVLNRPSEYWPILHLIDPDKFYSYDRFIYDYTYDGKRPRNVDQLRELLRPIMIRRRKKDILKDLPPPNRRRREYELSNKARRLYRKVLSGIYEELAQYDPFGIGGQQKRVISILAQIMRLKQVCAIDMAQHTAERAIALSDVRGPDEQGKKVLIFSQFRGSAYHIAQRLGHEAVCTVKRGKKGFVSMTADQRDELFESIRGRDEVKFVVTTEAAKEGHNLEYCYWVIFNDLFWTPAGHEQAEGRGYGRLSNPHGIDTDFMIFKDTIMTWILDLLRLKQGIINETVEGVEASREDSVATALIEKLRESMWSRGGSR